ncbi:MAG: hypothetical protein M1600_12355 [Firmicutes bacterium]|nr:hypothetical protein [Bacillota bacterium]
MAANSEGESFGSIAAAVVIRDPIWQKYLMKVEVSDSSPFVDGNERYWNNHQEVEKTCSLPASYRELRRLTVRIWERTAASDDP